VVKAILIALWIAACAALALWRDLDREHQPVPVIHVRLVDATAGEDRAGFIAAITRDGWRGTNERDALKYGEQVCAMMSGADSEQWVIEWLVDNGVARAAATPFVVDAHRYLCPGA
jgi:hypothetical protein